ncbi:MAG: hypothetical protein DME02_23510 [Candidatus Rokuibacteriota bacterium]|nr:MAG: hypothetical protein DME02_23510 [Candidatus Rokubacteria bacterium]
MLAIGSAEHLADRELNVWECQWRERCAARETLDTFEAGRARLAMDLDRIALVLIEDSGLSHSVVLVQRNRRLISSTSIAMR